MPDLPPESEVSPVHPRPMLNASAEPRGLIRRITHEGPTDMDVEAGAVVLGLA